MRLPPARCNAKHVLDFLQASKFLKMWKMVCVMVRDPWGSIKFTYAFAAQTFLVCLKFVLLPHLPRYQTFRTQIHRAYWSSASTFLFPLIHRLPVIGCPETRARKVGDGWTAYVIPGTKQLDTVAVSPGTCVIVYAHGGGYARGEARMYLNYMEHWQSEAAKRGLEIIFVSVEYRKLTTATQRSSFLLFVKSANGRGIITK